MLHKNISLGENHKLHNWEYANAASRVAANGFTSTDIGKIAWQKDNDTFWMLKTSSPIVWVSVGKEGVPSDSLDFNLASVATGAVGRLKWNDTDGTLEVGLKGGSSTLQIGQEMVKRVYNNTGGTLVDGQVVYITGASVDRLTVALADADSEATSSKTFGVVTETINNNSEGFITTFGLVRGLNTSLLNEGDTLYLSSVSGQYTNVEPIPPQHRVIVGYVVRKNATDGSIFVSVSNGYELDELHDVLVTNIQNSQVIAYDAVSGLWKNKSPTVFNTRLVTANTNVSVTDYTIRCNCQLSDIIVALPAANTVNGFVFVIKKINNSIYNAVITPVPTELIDGLATAVVTTYNQSVTIQSNGTSWDIL